MIVKTFRFGLGDTAAEDFLAATSDPQTINIAYKELALPEKQRHRHISGRITRVKSGSNLCWSWQHVESEWRFPDITIELCDGLLSYVEAHPDEWLRIGRFCPWSCHIKREEST
jgi:hypothetical protein